MQRTIYELLGTGALNLEDALSADLSDMFTMSPDFGAYTYVPSDTRIFDPKLARIDRPKTAAEAAALPDCDDPEKIQKQLDGNRRSDSKSLFHSLGNKAIPTM